MQIGALPARANDAPLVLGDGRRILNDVGWKPKLDLEAGFIGYGRLVASRIWIVVRDELAVKNIAILGTGMAGFGAAHAAHGAGVRPVMYDMHDHIGGHTASYEFPGGWTFDEGPHVSFTDNGAFQDLFAANIGGKYEEFATRVNNYWKGHWIKHPAQINLHGCRPTW